MNASPDKHLRIVQGLRLGIASVWLTHGLLCKLLGAVPRHQLIVARVVGEPLSGPVIYTVGIIEVALAVWVISGRYPKSCAAVQTGLIASMNVFELKLAADLLIAPTAMVLANMCFLGVAWYCALRSPMHSQTHPHTELT